jgi:Ca2+-binding EF-hand superfamily protein
LTIRNITTALALTCAVAVPAAHAQSAQDVSQTTNVDVWFERFDKNKDEKLTIDEFGHGKTYFATLDLDRDGALTRDEAKQALLRKSGTHIDWKKMDTDSDGYITVREWTGTPEEFDTYDLDQDRVISRYDRDLAREKSRAKGRLEAFDKDKDGLVSMKEWPADEGLFRQRDRNHDGMLSVDELAEDVKRKDS